MLENVVQVRGDNLLAETARLKLEGYRFVTASCTAVSEAHYDMLYHFDRELQLKHLRLTISGTAEVPSISAVFFAAFLVENEIQDLFGLRFHGLAIDYGRTLYLDGAASITPFCHVTVCQTSRPGSAAAPNTEAEVEP